MNDALLEEIKLAFRTQNLKPIRRCFFLHEKDGDFACPIVALALHRGEVDRADPGLEIDAGTNSALEAGAISLGEPFVLGVLQAWDGHKMDKDDPDFQRGFALGCEAAQQLCPRDPPT